MYDQKKIGSMIEDVEKFRAEIKGFNVNNINDLQDSMKLRATSMNIFAILNRLIDIGTEIIAEEKVGAPARYEDIMPLLVKAGVINNGAAEELNDLIKERNYFAHFYQEVTAKKVWDTLLRLEKINNFVLSVKKRLKTQEQN